MFSQADQDVAGGEVLVPGRVEDAVSCSEDPLVTDEAGSTQQLLRAALIQHHLPAGASHVLHTYITTTFQGCGMFYHNTTLGFVWWERNVA